MGWSVGFDTSWNRDIGYGVPAKCDHPDCDKDIDRGLSYVCGGEPYGGEEGCGLYFCSEHLFFNENVKQVCEKCLSPDIDDADRFFTPKPDTDEWTNHKMTDPSWEQWRKENGIINEID